MEQKTSHYVLYGTLGVLIAVTFAMIGYWLGLSDIPDYSTISQFSNNQIQSQSQIKTELSEDTNESSNLLQLEEKVEEIASESEIKFPSVSYKDGEWDIRKVSLEDSPNWRTTTVLDRIELTDSQGNGLSLIHDCEGKLLANAGNYGYGDLICFGKNYLGYFYKDTWHEIASYEVNSVDEIVFLEDSMIKSTSSGDDILFIAFDENSALGYQGMAANAFHLTHAVDLKTNTVDTLNNSPYYFDGSYLFFNDSLDKALIFAQCVEGCPAEAFYYFDLSADTSQPVIYYKDFPEVELPFTPTTTTVKWLSNESVEIMGKVFDINRR